MYMVQQTSSAHSTRRQNAEHRILVAVAWPDHFLSKHAVAVYWKWGFLPLRQALLFCLRSSLERSPAVCTTFLHGVVCYLLHGVHFPRVPPKNKPRSAGFGLAMVIYLWWNNKAAKLIRLADNPGKAATAWLMCGPGVVTAEIHKPRGQLGFRDLGGGGAHVDQIDSFRLGFRDASPRIKTLLGELPMSGYFAIPRGSRAYWGGEWQVTLPGR